MSNKKIFATIDLSKIDKKKVVTESYTKRDGTECVAKRYRIEIIPLRVSKPIGTKGMAKTHFIIEGQTKEEREAKVESVSLGDGMQFPEDDFGGF